MNMRIKTIWLLVVIELVVLSGCVVWLMVYQPRSEETMRTTDSKQTTISQPVDAGNNKELACDHNKMDENASERTLKQLFDKYPDNFDILDNTDFSNQLQVPNCLRDTVKYTVKNKNDNLETVEMAFFNQKINKKFSIVKNDSLVASVLTTLNYNQSLKNVVLQFLKNNQLDKDSVSYTYTNLVTNAVEQMNALTSRIAASTYKVPTAMLILDDIKKGVTQLSQSIPYEETTITVDEALTNMLVDSSNEAAEALIANRGGFQTTYQDMLKYGRSKGEVKTISAAGNLTTADYFKQVLDYLWANKKQYTYVYEKLRKASPTEYYRSLIKEDKILQKYGWYENSLNAAVIYEGKTPYTLALFTENFTLEQFSQLSYVIHRWHILHG